MSHIPINRDRTEAAAMVRGIDGHPKQKMQRACAEKIPVTKENAPAATEAGFETELNRNYKRLPPYGKQQTGSRMARQFITGTKGRREEARL